MGNRSGNKDEEEGGGGGWNREVKRERMSGSESEQGREWGQHQEKRKAQTSRTYVGKKQPFHPP